MTQRMPFLVSTPQRGIQVITVPVGFLEDQHRVFESINPEIQGRQRNENFLTMVRHICETEKDLQVFGRSVTSIMFYLMFRDAAHNPEKKAERDRTVAMSIEITPQQLATTLFDDMDEFKSEVAQIEAAANIEPGNKPTIH